MFSKLSNLLQFKSWFSKNLFLKKKTNINELNFLNFLKFFFKTKKASDSLLDLNFDDNSKDFSSQVIDLKKSFFISIRDNRKFVSNFIFISVFVFYFLNFSIFLSLTWGNFLTLGSLASRVHQTLSVWTKQLLRNKLPLTSEDLS